MHVPCSLSELSEAIAQSHNSHQRRKRWPLSIYHHDEHAVLEGWVCPAAAPFRPCCRPRIRVVSPLELERAQCPSDSGGGGGVWAAVSPDPASEAGQGRSLQAPTPPTHLLSVFCPRLPPPPLSTPQPPILGHHSTQQARRAPGGGFGRVCCACQPSSTTKQPSAAFALRRRAPRQPPAAPVCEPESAGARRRPGTAPSKGGPSLQGKPRLGGSSRPPRAGAVPAAAASDSNRFSG
jgi:hypothetical protein